MLAQVLDVAAEGEFAILVDDEVLHQTRLVHAPGAHLQLVHQVFGNQAAQGRGLGQVVQVGEAADQERHVGILAVQIAFKLVGQEDDLGRKLAGGRLHLLHRDAAFGEARNGVALHGVALRTGGGHHVLCQRQAGHSQHGAQAKGGKTGESHDEASWTG